MGLGCGCCFSVRAGLLMIMLLLPSPVFASFEKAEEGEKDGTTGSLKWLTGDIFSVTVGTTREKPP